MQRPMSKTECGIALAPGAFSGIGAERASANPAVPHHGTDNPHPLEILECRY